MGLYRAILTLAAPVLLIAALLRILRGAESWGDLRQRLVRGPGGGDGTIWLHGASNGELTSARPLVEALRAAFPDRALVVTANTVTGRDLAAGWALPGVAARLAPFDFRPALRRFRAVWRPAALVVLENELWPNRLDTASEPVLVVGARMSEQSHRLWSRFPRLARRVLSHVRRLWPQDPGSADRFRALGLAADRIGPTATLKSAVALAAPDPGRLAALAAVFARADTLLAASTHEGEEAAVIEGFVSARARRPDLKLILAPRHPARAAGIAALIAPTGLPWAQRRAGVAPDPDTAIYLADTLGEMPLWYALAGVTFVGGSLAPRGGHTPFEPAGAGSAILHGPHTANFTEAYAALDRERGAVAVEDAGDIAAALAALEDAGAQAAMAARAARALARFDTGQAVIDDAVASLRSLLASDPGP